MHETEPRSTRTEIETRNSGSFFWFSLVGPWHLLIYLFHLIKDVVPDGGQDKLHLHHWVCTNQHGYWAIFSLSQIRNEVAESATLMLTKAWAGWPCQLSFGSVHPVGPDLFPGCRNLKGVPLLLGPELYLCSSRVESVPQETQQRQIKEGGLPIICVVAKERAWFDFSNEAKVQCFHCLYTVIIAWGRRGFQVWWWKHNNLEQHSQETYFL